VAVLSRIIPTRVGRRISFANTSPSTADHPHACGEKGFKGVVGAAKKGSSPRVWGEASFHRPPLAPERIIPTRVGRSARHKEDTKYIPDHPHACGEKHYPRLGLT